MADAAAPMVQEKKPAATKKRKRAAKKKPATRRRRIYRRYTGRSVVMTPYGTLAGYGSYRRKAPPQASFGRRLGGLLGEGLGMGFDSFSKAIGLGGYQIQSNSLIDMSMGTSPPLVVNSSANEAVTIRHREYIGDLVSASGSPTAFQLLPLVINPGNSTLFPFLAPIAQNFQEYEIRGMIIELKTLSSDFATNMALGSIFVGTQYNALANAPQNKQQLENLEYSTSSKPSCSLIHPIECARSLNVDTHLYISNNNNLLSLNGMTADPRLYDMGTIYIGSQGIPVADTPIAEIWVSYECNLYKPILATGNAQSAIWQTSDVSTTWANGTQGTLRGSKSNSSLFTAVIQQSDGQFLVYLPNQIGRWQITWQNVNNGSTASFATSANNGANFFDVFRAATPPYPITFAEYLRDVTNPGCMMANIICDVPAINSDGSLPFVALDFSVTGATEGYCIVTVTCWNKNTGAP